MSRSEIMVLFDTFIPISTAKWRKILQSKVIRELKKKEAIRKGMKEEEVRFFKELETNCKKEVKYFKKLFGQIYFDFQFTDRSLIGLDYTILASISHSQFELQKQLLIKYIKRILHILPRREFLKMRDSRALTSGADIRLASGVLNSISEYIKDSVSTFIDRGFLNMSKAEKIPFISGKSNFNGFDIPLGSSLLLLRPNGDLLTNTIINFIGYKPVKSILPLLSAAGDAGENTPMTFLMRDKESHMISQRSALTNIEKMNIDAKIRIQKALRLMRYREKQQSLFKQRQHTAPLSSAQVRYRMESLATLQTELNRTASKTLSRDIVKILIVSWPVATGSDFAPNNSFAIRLQLEDLRKSIPVLKGGPFSREHSQWTHGQMDKYISELGRLMGFGVDFISARYTSQICSRCGQLGEKGYLIHELHNDLTRIKTKELFKWASIDYICRNCSEEDLANWAQRIFSRLKSKNRAELLDTDTPNIFDQYQTNKGNFYWYPTGAGNFFRCRYCEENHNNIVQLLGRDENGVKNILKPNAFLRRLEVINALLTRIEEHPRTQSYRAVISTYLDLILQTLEDVGQYINSRGKKGSKFNFRCFQDLTGSEFEDLFGTIGNHLDYLEIPKKIRELPWYIDLSELCLGLAARFAPWQSFGAYQTSESTFINAFSRITRFEWTILIRILTKWRELKKSDTIE